MSDHERGAYTPPTADAPLSFDPRQPVRGARPIPVTLILSVLVVAALVAAIFVFYQSGIREAAEAPQAVGTPVEAMRSPATAETQPQDPAAGLEIYRADGGETVIAEPTFVPPPEQPQVRATPPVVVPQPPPSAATVKALKPAISAPPIATKALPPPAKPVPAPAAVAKAVPPAPKKAVVEPKPALAAKPVPVSGGGAVVQIGAVSSTALADKAWSEAVAAAPGLGAGKGKSVEKIERNGGALYRTAVTGFASRADAQAFCARLRSGGKSCFVR